MPKNDAFSFPASVIRTGKLLQFFSSTRAAKFALKLFGTPPKFKTPEREIMMQKSAKNELVLVPELQSKIMLYTYGYSKTRILIAHGWGGRGTQLYNLADALLEYGMMVISFDAPAHGMSEGTMSNLPEYQKTISFINTNYGPFDAAIGHSFGGINLLLTMSKRPFLKKLVIIGIDDSISNIVDDFIKKMELNQKVSEKMKQQMTTLFRKDIESTSPIETAKNVTIPTLVLHDSNDSDVDVSSAFRIRQNLVNGELWVTKGLGHRKIFRDPKVIQRVINFIKN